MKLCIVSKLKITRWVHHKSNDVLCPSVSTESGGDWSRVISPVKLHDSHKSLFDSKEPEYDFARKMIFRRLAKQVILLSRNCAAAGRQVVVYVTTELQSSGVIRRINFVSETGLLRLSDKVVISRDNVYSVPLKKNISMSHYMETSPFPSPEQQVKEGLQKLKVFPCGVSGSDPFSDKSLLKTRQAQYDHVIKSLKEKWCEIEKKLPGWKEKIVEKLAQFQKMLVDKLNKRKKKCN